MDLKESRCEDVDWSHMTVDKFQWPGFVSTVKNFRFHERPGILNQLNDYWFFKNESIHWIKLAIQGTFYHFS